MEQQRKPHWWQRRQLLWGVGIIVAIALLISLFGGYSFEWKWTGFVKDANFHKRTLWDWLELLIIPAVLAGGGLWFNRQQREQELRIAAGQREQELRIAAGQREQELETANIRAQDEALQVYIDQISLLLTDKERPLHKAPPSDNLRTVARARTLTVLGRLDGIRKLSLLQFLYESNLVVKGRPILGLMGADLSEAALRKAYLTGADLRGANLRQADLRGADLREADLSGADLRGADLSDAKLSRAKLSRAKLHGVALMGDHLKRANQIGCSLSDLIGANVKTVHQSGADLSYADLTEAIGIYGETLELEADSLKGATMPDGQKYEDWLKSKDRGEDGEHSSPS